jgi:hypothetical protein
VIYVADTGSHLIKKISGGTVTTAAGVRAAPEDGEDYAEGGYLDGPAEKALFNFPTGLFIAGDILFIADTGNHAVRMLDSRGEVTTAAGNGEPGDTAGSAGDIMMNKPSAVAYRDGTLYIADTLNNKIKAVLSGPAGGR